MALNKSLQISKLGFSGVLVADSAYWKVDQISGTKTKITFQVGAYVEGAVVSQSTYEFSPDMDGENFIAQAYAYLKTLPEFADAKDC